MLAHDFLKKDDRGFTPTSSSRSAWYFGLLVFAKLLRCIGIFIIDILAKQVHVVGLLWLMKFISSMILVPVQKPLSHGKSLKKSLVTRVVRLAFFNCIIEILWLYGITFCGPLRSILVFEQSSAVILVALMAIIKRSSTPAKTRGLLAMGIGYIALILMDSDRSVESHHAESHKHQGVLNHIFYHAIHWLGVSDHKSGILLLAIAMLIKIAYDSSFRCLAIEIGGPKRLYSLVSMVSVVLLMPLAIFAYVNGLHIEYHMEFGILLCTASIIIMVLDFYAESLCFQHVADPVMAAARWSPMIMFSCAFGLALMWYTPDLETGSHGISGGVFVTLICFSIASFALTSSTSPKSRGGHYVGLSETGAPLYTYGEAFLQKTSRSVMLFVKETLSEVLANSDSRRIFWFLCANLIFCGVEFLYGFWTNSLGLISDGFHMLFDCSALVMGLVAAVMSRWTASRYYSYGYGRVEVLSGFINALFLIVIAFFIFLEALERLYDPPEVLTDKLMFVAVCGLIVNIFGMFAFHGGSDSDDHTHGSHGHSHGGHGHSHGGHGHSHGGHGHSHGGNANMQGVFLHVLADTLGSVFVIISTLLIQYFGWKWVDPLCSLILSMLILGSVIPLLKASMATLMQNIPPELENEFDQLLSNVLHVEGVLSLSRSHLWQHKSDLAVGSVHVQVSSDANEQLVRREVYKMFKGLGVNKIAIQVEKERFLQKIQSICPSYRIPIRLNRGFSSGQSHEKTLETIGHDHNGHLHSHGNHCNEEHGNEHNLYYHDAHRADESHESLDHFEHGHSHNSHEINEISSSTNDVSKAHDHLQNSRSRIGTIKHTH